MQVWLRRARISAASPLRLTKLTISALTEFGGFPAPTPEGAPAPMPPVQADDPDASPVTRGLDRNCEALLSAAACSSAGAALRAELSARSVRSRFPYR